MTESASGQALQGRQLANMPAPSKQAVDAAYAAVIDAEMPPQIEDPAGIARAIQERIRQGTLAQSMEALESLPSWGDSFPNEKVIVHSFKLLPSAFVIQEGPNKGKKGVYAVVELMTADGELTLVQTGAGNVLTQLVKTWEESRFPLSCVLEVKDTATPGRTVQWLRNPEAKA